MLRVVAAELFYDKSQDGLSTSNPWYGNVYMNPPYGMSGGASMAEKFVDRALSEYSSGAVSSVIMLLRAGFGCQWLQKVVSHPHCIVWKRVEFVRGGGAVCWMVWVPQLGRATHMAAS